MLGGKGFGYEEDVFDIPNPSAVGPVLPNIPADRPPNTPYQIANVTDLNTLANDINDYNKCFIMTDDINLAPNIPGNQVFTRAVIAWDINNANSVFDGNAFVGVLDRRGIRLQS